MSTLRHPIGPQPPSVYWRRRLLVLLGVVAVVVIVVLIVVRPGGGAEGGPQTPAPSTTPSSTPTFAAEDPDELCDPSVIRVEAVTDGGSYPEGVNPMISMTITNTSSTACTFDVGTGAQEYVITSGADRIWSSRDCQANPTESPMILEPGTAVPTTPFPWDRTRSSTDTCDPERPVVTAGGATYRLSVSVGEVTSERDVPFLLN